MSFLLPASLAKHLSGTKVPAGGAAAPAAPTRGRAATGGAAARVFTEAEVAQHASESDCYTVVEGRVYDVTKYLRLHPGGFKLLFKNAGADSTADFLALRHSAKSRVILDQYYVGELAGTATRSLAAPGAAQQPRKVGALVGPQPYLGVSLSHISASSSSGSVTPLAPAPVVGAQYPLPRSGALHPSSSHPDRLSAYSEHHARRDSQGSVPIVAGPSFSINLLPPSSPEKRTRSSASMKAAMRSPTTLALEKHLSDCEKHVSPPSGSEPAQTVTLMQYQLEDAMVDDLPAQDRFPSFREKPPVPLFSDTVPLAVTHSQSSSAASSASVAAASTIAAPALPAAALSVSSYGPRHFVLKRRVLQEARDVQLLSFEPLFVHTAAASGSSSAASSSSAALSVGSSAHPSALDPAFWLRIPPGQHISIGTTMASGEYVKRPYTPVAHGSGCFDLLVKSYPLGEMSRTLHALPIGTRVDVFGPAGLFEFETQLRSRTQWVMIAQGTGIAPFWQLIKHIRAEAGVFNDGATAAHSTAAASRALHLSLLYCNRDTSDILLHTELSQLAADSSGHLVVKHVLSKPSAPVLTADTHAGRLNADILSRFLASLDLPVRTAVSASSGEAVGSAPASSCLYLVCGSDDFHADVTRMLQHTQHVQLSDIFCF